MEASSTAEVVLFWVFGVLAVGTGMAMLTMRNIVHAALMLVLNFFAISALYLGLESPFLSIVQIIVYAGAIMILFLFVIMLLGVDRDDTATDDKMSHKLVAGLLSLVVVGGVLFALAGTFTHAASACGDLVSAEVAAAAESGDMRCVGLADANAANPQGSVGVIGERLFTRYTFAFESAAVLLTVATLGAMVLGRRRDLDQDDDQAWQTDVVLPSLADAERLLASVVREGDEEPSAWSEDVDSSDDPSSPPAPATES